MLRKRKMKIKGKVTIELDEKKAATPEKKTYKKETNEKMKKM